VFWVLVFAGIAVAGLVMVVCYAVWLAHKAADVLSEVGVVTDQLGRLADLAAQIGAPAATGPVGTWSGSATVLSDGSSE
jgi:hypothetical protein